MSIPLDSENPIESNPKKCPFHRIEEASKKILIRVTALFGKPNLVHKNVIWWVPWAKFITFLEYYRDTMDQRDLPHPQNFVLYEPIINKIIYGVPVDQNHDEMSSLGTHLCLKFFLEHEARLQSETNTDAEMRIQDHFYANAMLIFQTYDSIFITGAQSCRSRDDWENSKESMKKTAVRIAMMGGGPQEIFTNYRKGRYHKELPEEHYALSIMPELASNDFLWKIQQHVRNAMQVIWWYGYCPALGDGTLEKAFEILYEIYTTMIIDRRFPAK